VKKYHLPENYTKYQTHMNCLNQPVAIREHHKGAVYMFILLKIAHHVGMWSDDEV
jgi:hypothetical protein